MALDAVLAIAHHVAAFALLGTLAAEWALVTPGMTAASIARVAKVDRAYGAVAMTLVTVGIARLFFGAVESSFLLGNLFFWAKMAAFGAVGLLSIRPTITYIRWGRAASERGSWQPPDSEVASTRRAVMLQLALFPLIPVCAALMARGFGS